MKDYWSLPKKEKSKRLFPDIERSIEAVLINRGIDTKKQKDSFLNPNYEKNLSNPFLLSGMKSAVQRILTARKKKEKICIYGDFDADGITSTALLADFFRQIGIEYMTYIPDRCKEGYGLNNLAIDYVKKEKTNLIVTTDCGVTSLQEVEYAKSLAIDTVIVDHHSLPKKLPNATAIVNPKLDNKKETVELAGVGVAFKLVCALAEKIDDYDNEQLKWLLDLVAIGTIADCVSLKYENRLLTKYGLIVLSKTKRIGLKQLFHVGSVSISANQVPSSTQVAFQIAPRLNAAGRMDHANLAFDLIDSSEGEESKARMLALDVEDKNKRRQKVTKQVFEEVDKRLSKNKLPNIIIEHSPHWEYGIVGLVAGKIAEKYNRPTLLLQETESLFRGSGRSIPQINLIKTLRKCEKLCERLGGHSQALGLSIKKDKLEKIREKVDEALKDELRELKEKEINVDDVLEGRDISNELTDRLEQLEPFGQGNKQPIFYLSKLQIVSARLVGNGEKHLKLLLKDDSSERKLDAIGFGLGKEYKTGNQRRKVDLLVNIEKNDWNGTQKPQMKIIDIDYLDD